MWLPKRPQSLADAKLDEQYVEDSILKILQVQGATRGNLFAEIMKLPYSLVEPIIRGMRDKDLIGTTGGAGIGGNAGLNFGLTEKGALAAAPVLARSPYFGASPVDVLEYTQAIQAQKFQTSLIRKPHLDAAFNDILISQDYLNQLGPAINSGGPIFLFGKPGNGKTTMAERIARLWRQGMFIPYTIQAAGEVIQVYDEKVHKRIPEEILPETHPLRVDPSAADPRWVYVFRPFIIVGGELTLEMLDLNFRQGQRSYEAPFQLKSNGGALLIDDFGRQKVKPTEFLNRWIYPLEKSMDFLSLANGKKIEVPFELLLILSTNLDPRDLGDEAFWRRIRYMIETPSPTEKEFKIIFQAIAAKKKIGFDEDAFGHLIQKYYKGAGREFRSVHPRDLLNRVADYISFFTLPSKLTRDLVDKACRALFGGLSAVGENSGQAEKPKAPPQPQQQAAATEEADDQDEQLAS